MSNVRVTPTAIYLPDRHGTPRVDGLSGLYFAIGPDDNMNLYHNGQSLSILDRDGVDKLQLALLYFYNGDDFPVEE